MQTSWFFPWRRRPGRPSYPLVVAGIALASLTGCSADTLPAQEWQAIAASQSETPTVDDQAITAAAEELVAAGVPGVVVRVVGPNRDETVAVGVSNVSTGQEIDADIMFNLGAASNPYLSALMLDYFDEGRLDLGDSVEQHLPNHFSYAWDMAIWDVLQHASGVPDYLEVGDDRGTVMNECIAEGNCAWDPADALGLVDGAEWEFQPGEGWGFSATNYVLIGELIEEVDDKPWDQALAEGLLTPMGLDDTYVPDYTSDDAKLAHAYVDLDGDGTIDDVTDLLPANAGADGALGTTANDAAAFFHALFTGQVLSEAGQVALYATAPTGFGPEDYGMGVSFIHGYFGGQVGITAENIGQSVFVEHDIETETTVVVMANRAGDLPAEEWTELIGTATGLPNRTIQDREAFGPGQLRFYCVLYEQS